MTEFKYGDLVECVDPSGDILPQGFYTVESIYFSYGETILTVRPHGYKGLLSVRRAARFVLAKEQGPSLYDETPDIAAIRDRFNKEKMNARS